MITEMSNWHNWHPYPCSHTYGRYDDENGHERCDECDRVVAADGRRATQ